MPEYNYNQNNSWSSPYDSTRKAVLNSFMWMFGGLLLTAATSFLLYQSGFFLRMLYSMPMLSLILAIAQIALVIGFSAAANKATAQGMKVLFLLYSVTLGISMTSLAYVYNFGSIAIAFAVASVYFGCLVIIGFTTKRDLTKVGTLMIAGLIALVITQLVMMLFRINMDTRLISIIGLLLFTGITARDVQRMHKSLYITQNDSMMQEKMSIYFALELYLDFINIFLYILRLIGNNSRN